MILLITFYYASHVAEKLAEIVPKLGKMPDYVKRWQVFHATSGSTGFKQLNIVYIEKGHGDDAMVEVPRMLKPIWGRDDVEPQIEVLVGVKDTMKIFS